MDYSATEILRERQAKIATGLGTIARQGAEEFGKFMRGQHPDVLKALPGGRTPSIGWGHPLLARSAAGPPGPGSFHSESAMSPAYSPHAVLPSNALAGARPSDLAALHKSQRAGLMSVEGQAPQAEHHSPRGGLTYYGSSRPFGLVADSKRPAVHVPLQTFGHELGHAYTIPGYGNGPRPASLDAAAHKYETEQPEGFAEVRRYGVAANQRNGFPVHAELDADALSHHFDSELAKRDPATHQRLRQAFLAHDARMQHRNPADPDMLAANSEYYRMFIAHPEEGARLLGFRPFG